MSNIEVLGFVYVDLTDEQRLFLHECYVIRMVL